MNLFILSANPVEAAQAHADTHVVKMILEACQMLYSAHWTSAYPELLENKSAVGISRAQKMLDVPAVFADAPIRKNTSERGYRPVHLHHPCTRWIRASLENYIYRDNFRPMPIKNGHGRRHVTALKMGKLPIFNLHRSKIKKLESFFILKFYHSNSRRTLILRKPLLP